MIDEAQARGSIDIMRDVAGPLPVAVIAVMLGIPPEDRGRFKHWSDDIAAAANLVQGLSDETLNRSAVAYQELTEYFRDLVGRMRSGTGEGVLAAMAAAEEQGDRLSEGELYANAILLLNAGHETTTNLIGNGTLALLQNRDQWRRLLDKPELVEDAVEELLRYDSPVQFTSRSALEDVDLREHRVAAGQVVMVMLGAANRDPEAFPDPDRLDVTRPEARHHVAFGQGPHYCLGAPLAARGGRGLQGPRPAIPGAPPRGRSPVLSIEFQPPRTRVVAGRFLSVHESETETSDMAALITEIWQGLREAGLPEVMLYLPDHTASRCHWDDTALIGNVRVALLGDQERNIVRIQAVDECIGIGVASPKGTDPMSYRFVVHSKIPAKFGRDGEPPPGVPEG